jgi:hypothetical protein
MEEYGNRDFRKVNLGLPIKSRNRARSSMEIMWEKTIMTGSGLYHLFIVISGMVYYSFTHISVDGQNPARGRVTVR